MKNNHQTEDANKLSDILSMKLDFQSSSTVYESCGTSFFSEVKHIFEIFWIPKLEMCPLPLCRWESLLDLKLSSSDYK